MMNFESLENEFMIADLVTCLVGTDISLSER